MMFCPIVDKPADLLTRVLSAAQYKNNRLWRVAPDWLLDTYKWHTWDIDNTTVLLTTDADEILLALTLTEQTPIMTVGIHSVEDITCYSLYTKLIRVIAFILRFVNNCRRPHTRKFSRLSVHEVQEARRCGYKVVSQPVILKRSTNYSPKKAVYLWWSNFASSWILMDTFAVAGEFITLQWQSQNTIYNILDTKDKSKKLKVKTQKSKEINRKKLSEDKI